MGTTGEEVEFPEEVVRGFGRDEVGVLEVLPSAAARFLRADQVRSSFSRTNLELVGFCFMTMNSQWFTLRRSSKYSTDQWYLGWLERERGQVAERGSKDAPLHQEDAGHQAVSDQHADAGKVWLVELAPHALVEAAHAVVCVGGALAVGDAVEEVAVVGALLPHALHLSGAWLEVAKVLLAETRLFEHGNLIAWEGRGVGVVRGQGAQDALGGLARAAVGRGEELQGVVWLEEGAQLAAGFLGLGPAQLGELDAVVRDELVDVAVLVALGLCMAHQDDHLCLG